MLGNTKQRSVLCIACMKTCMYIFYFLINLPGDLVHTLNKEECERVGRSRAPAQVCPRHPLVQVGEESQETLLKEEPPVTDHAEIPFSSGYKAERKLVVQTWSATKTTEQFYFLHEEKIQQLLEGQGRGRGKVDARPGKKTRLGETKSI